MVKGETSVTSDRRPRRKRRRLAALRRRKPKEQEEAAGKEEPRRPRGLEADLVKLDVFGGLKGIARQIAGNGTMM